MITRLKSLRLLAHTVFSVGALGLVFALGTTANAATLSPDTLPTAQVGTPYSTMLQVSDLATSTLLNWNIVQGSLPNNLSLEPLNSGLSARISGSPTIPGAYSFRVQLLNGTQFLLEKTYTLAVWASGATSSGFMVVPSAQVGVPFSYTFPTIEGTAPFTWVITNGSLPTGIILNSSGMITGTANATSSNSFTVQATDALGRTSSYPLTFSVNPSNFTVTTASLPSGTVGTNYSSQLQSQNGTGNSTWIVTSGSLPAGLTIGTNGLIQGTPLTAGTYALTVRATDANGALAHRQLALVINPQGGTSVDTHPTITNTNLVSGMVGSNYAAYLGATGGMAPYTWRVTSGALPAGLQLGTDGSITGLPMLAGTYAFTLEVTDAQNRRASQLYTFTVQSSLTPSPAELDARLQILRSIGVGIHSLVKLPDDRNSNTQQDSAVYYIGTDGRRHAFPHARVYFSWFGNFLGIRTINASDLARITLGSNVTYKPGTRLVKFPSDTRVYAISANRTLHWITSESLAQSMFGTNWNRQIDDVPSAFMMDYTFGANISSSADYNANTAQGSVNTISDTLPLL